MNIFNIVKKYDKSPEGMYQIEELYLNGDDVTNKINQGEHFHCESYDDLTKYLSKKFKILEKTISFQTNNDDEYFD